VFRGNFKCTFTFTFTFTVDETETGRCKKLLNYPQSSPWSGIIPMNLKVAQIMELFLTFYGNRRFFRLQKKWVT
jgi:hypothetical protein